VSVSDPKVVTVPLIDLPALRRWFERARSLRCGNSRRSFMPVCPRRQPSPTERRTVEHPEVSRQNFWL